MNWYQFTALIVGYALAAMFSSHVSVSVGLTVWGSFWTYIILAFWWFIGHFLLIPVVIAVLFGVSAVGLGGRMVVAWIIDKVKGR